MTLISRIIAFAQISNTAFFKADGPFVLDTSDLDSYLFNREARMDEAWESERGARLRSELVYPEPSVRSKGTTV